MRLFIAIDIPDSVKDHLAFLQRSLEPVKGLKLIHPKDTHLTLNFLGDRPDSELDSIITQLNEVSFNSFSLKLSGVGFFPSTEAPRVCWVGLEKNKDLDELQQAIDKIFAPPKSFKAHLTLARLKHLDKADEDFFISQTEKLEVKPLSFKVSSFRLYKSTLTPVGPIYEVLETFKA